MNNNQPTTVLIIRHTDVHNPNDVLYGRLPRFRLSELGLKQAEVTAAALADEQVPAFYVSPQLRARQTTRILAAAHPHAEMHQSALLDEVRTAWQGRPHSELEEHGFNFYGNPLHHSDETIEDIWGRIQRFMARVRKRHGGQTVAGVTHGDVAILARSAYLRLPLELTSLRHPNVYPNKGSITRFTFPPDLRETYPLSVEYYDPNSEGAPWSEGWVRLEEHEGFQWPHEAYQ